MHSYDVKLADHQVLEVVGPNSLQCASGGTTASLNLIADEEIRAVEVELVGLVAYSSNRPEGFCILSVMGFSNFAKRSPLVFFFASARTSFICASMFVNLAEVWASIFMSFDSMPWTRAVSP